MKKYVIQDVEDRQFYCEGNLWSIDVTLALAFTLEIDAWDIATNLYVTSDYVLTVLPITQ